MLNSVWNLCRACPMPTDEKQSYTEYKRSFTWHPNPEDVVQKPPESDKTMEPALSRKKKYPELAYKKDSFSYNEEGMGYQDAGDSNASRHLEQEARARKEERLLNGASISHKDYVKQPEVDGEPLMAQSYSSSQTHGNPAPVEDTSDVPKVTEYRSNFAWPRDCPVLPGTHRAVFYGLDQSAPKALEDGSFESAEGITEEQNEDEQTSPRKKGSKTEYKSKYQPFSSYIYVDGSWKKTQKLGDVEGKPLDETNPWYTEVVERIKKADEYRIRSQGRPFYGDHSPLIPGKSMEDDSPLPTHVLIATSRPSPRSASSERKKDRTPESRREISPRRQPKAFREGRTPDGTSGEILSPKKSARPVSVPRGEPSAKGTDVTTPPGVKPHPVPRRPPSSVVNGEEPKVWLKPTTKEKGEKEMVNGEQLEKDVDEKDAAKGLTESEDQGTKRISPQDAIRPSSLQTVNGDLEYKSPSPLPEPPTGPVPLTTVKSPEEVTGIKSPDPETWTIPLETNKELEWTDGHIPVDAKRIKYPPEFLMKAEAFPENGALIESGVNT
ncbi:nuclear protein MDM1-like isoform X3 [Limulus polyphemus]|uniref:Nuclear protein MDM1 n=2 Tax=Limulus polyphemus TaxID=6850 RepID=A0ABM1TLR9_LIMPO|nr:nuclear protein MDM1-like isoform X3 [Limulus polyphemus]